MADKIFRIICRMGAFLIPILLFCIMFQLIVSSSAAWKRFGISFLFSTNWDPVAHEYGALPAIIGTIITTLIAILTAVPLGFITAFYLSDLPPKLEKPLSCGLDLLAAIPSVVYGMWGLLVFVPVMQNHVQPFLSETLHLQSVPFIGDQYNGFGYLTAGLVLAFMILPYISACMRDVFRMTPALMKEAAIGIGCTRWETARDIVVRYGIRGMAGGIFIGLGRALGETMAVLFVIGNIMEIPKSIFNSGTTIAATLANNFAEADGITKSVLFALALILLGISFLVQFAAQYFMNRSKTA